MSGIRTINEQAPGEADRLAYGDLAEDVSGMPDRARILGGEPARIKTSGRWQALARRAYQFKRDTDENHRRWLTMTLANRLEEMTGEAVPLKGITIPVIQLDGHTFTIRTRPGKRKGEPEFDLFVHIACSFCERPNPRLFRTLAELGECLKIPLGTARPAENRSRPSRWRCVRWRL